ARMNAFMEGYYGRPAAEMRARQATYAGPAEGAASWLASWVEAGVDHLVLRFAGDHPRHLDAVSRFRDKIAAYRPRDSFASLRNDNERMSLREAERRTHLGLSTLNQRTIPNPPRLLTP